jgi:putative protease
MQTDVANQSAVPELLSPAGDFEAMRAAVANGADAVYFGLDQFNARHRATNFTADVLADTMDYLHRHNVKGFVTFNTLIFSDELDAAVEYVRTIAAAGVDAVIVQDLGVAKLIREIAPTLPVHGSTQMTLTEARGIAFVERLGVRRVVLARELSVDDIEKIAASTAMPLEVFIHGALCVAYSGQCLTSESLGGRSANRGQCAQACRLPYELIVDGQPRDLGDVRYLVSPNDLAAFDLVGRLAKVGVASLKIEGRLKKPHYVAATTQTYRAALDAAAIDRPFAIDPQQKGDLEQVFSRGLSNGFLDGVDHQALVPGRFPKSRGRRVGTLAYTTGRGFVVDVEGDADLKPGDGVVFDEGRPDEKEKGGRVYHVKPLVPQAASGLAPAAPRPNRIEIELGNRDARPSEIKPRAIVWKTDDPAVTKRLEQSFAKDRVVRRVPIDMTVVARTGAPLTLSITDGTRTAVVQSTESLPKADKYPATDRLLRDQLGMLLTTPFALRDLTATIEGDPIAPKSMLADVRRRGVERLIELRKRTHAVVGATLASPAPFIRQGAGEASLAATNAAMHVMARTLEQVEALVALPDKPAGIYCDFEDVRRYKAAVDLLRAAGIPCTVATMRILKPGEEGWLRQILASEPDAILVRNLAAIEFYQDVAPGLPLVGDYALNVANHLTADIFKQSGLVRVVPSYDLNWRQMNAMLSASDPGFFECVVHQHMPMFHMEHCVFAHTLSDGKDYRDCGRPCEKHQVDLRDRMGKPHPLVADSGCRNTLYNAEAQTAAEFIPEMAGLGIRHFRVELLRERGGEVGPLVRRYADILTGREPPKMAIRTLRVLNQLGVTRGTLDRA